MKLSVTFLNLLAEQIESKINHNRIATITVVNSCDLIFAFSVYRKEKMLISLNHHFPFVDFIKVDESISTNVGHINDTLRKELRDGYITDVDILNNDRVLRISLQKSNDFYEKEDRFLIIELIPHRPNLILLDQNNHIIFAYHTSGLDTSRPLMKGLVYPSLPSYNFVNNEALPYEEYHEFAQNYLYHAKEDRLKEKYQTLFKHIKNKIKSLQNKLDVLDKEASKAKDNLIYKDHGDMVLALSQDNEELNNYLKDNNLTNEYDSSLSFGVNANKFYKKYKKAKRTLEMNSIEKEKCFESLNYHHSLEGQIKYMDDEELLSLAQELMPNKFHNAKKKNVKANYSYVICNNHKIYFGKNAEQNENITFKLATKDYWYFHIKDYHGAHVVIFNENPSDEEKLVAAEMCLILSNKTTGEIMYSQIRNIKKNNTKGLALLDTYQLIVLHEVREETIRLMENYRH